MILAEASVSQSGIMWIAGLLAVSGPVSALASLVGHFATRREVEALDKRVTQLTEDNHELRRELQDMERRLQASSEARALANHERTNEILEAVSRLAGRFDESTSRDHAR